MWSEVHGFEPLVPRRERNESLRGTRTVKDATKVRLEAVAYLPGTDGPNPGPSSAESGTNRRRRVRGRRTQNGSAARSFAQAIVRHPSFGRLFDHSERSPDPPRAKRARNVLEADPVGLRQLGESFCKSDPAVGRPLALLEGFHRRCCDA